MRKSLSIILSLLLLVFSSCSSFFEKPVYRIGIDPDFYSLELDGMEANVYAYCNELFKTIAKKEGMDIAFVKTSWDILERGLKNGKYDAIISAKPEYFQLNDTFDYSSLILPTGPDLVVEKDLKAKSLADLKGKIIAYISGSKTDLLLEGHPDITIRSYPSMATAISSITDGNSDGALIPNLFAQHYVHNLQPNTFQIVGPPLTDAGLRLFTEHGKHQDLLNFVDNGLSALREESQLKALQKKWSLIYE